MSWRLALMLPLLFVLGCATEPAPDDAGRLRDAATSMDAASPVDAASEADVGGDAGAPVSCSVDGNPGVCIDTTDCAAMSDRQSTPGYCPGPSAIQCCTPVPDVASNPPTPDGYRLMMQSEVTTEMTHWAVMILRDPVTYPMFSTAMMTFGTQPVLARVEWHPPDFQNSSVHRGVTLYVPL